MLIFLYGQDTYRLKEKEKEIVDEYKKIHKCGLSLKYFKGLLSADELKKEIKTHSLFKEKKLIVLKDVFSEKIGDEIYDILSNRKDESDIFLIVGEGAIKKNDKLFGFLNKKAKVQEFAHLSGVKLENWVKKEIENCGSKIQQEALEIFIAFVGNDLWQISNEIKKLAAFTKNKKKIESEDIELLVKANINTDIFKTIDAIASKNKKSAVLLLRNHQEKGESPLYLLSMINFQFRNLLIIKDLIEKKVPSYLISKRAALHPFVVKKSYYQLNKFSRQDLEIIYQKIFQTDLFIKTGKLEPENAVDLLLTKI